MGIDREAGECFYKAQGGFGKNDSSVFSRSAEAFHIHMDASGHAIGATLPQQDDNEYEMIDGDIFRDPGGA